MTLEQINNMKHCIGYDRKHVKRGKYEAYRNYFNVGDSKDDSWDELVTEGYARQYERFDQIIYCVSEKGMKLLESILDIQISKMD